MRFIVYGAGGVIGARLLGAGYHGHDLQPQARARQSEDRPARASAGHEFSMSYTAFEASWTSLAGGFSSLGAVP